MGDSSQRGNPRPVAFMVTGKQDSSYNFKWSLKNACIPDRSHYREKF